MIEDFVAYVADIIMMRKDIFAFKTASFVKRHLKAWGNVFHHLWEECVKIKIGFGKFNEDVRIYFRYRKGRRDYKYDKISYK